MRLQARAREFAEPLQKSPDFIARQSLTSIIEAAVSFLERIVAGQNSSNGGGDLRRRRVDEQCRQCTMIETNPVGHGQTLAAASLVRRRNQDGFFHADVPKQRNPELLVGAGATGSRIRGGKQSFDPPVIVD